VRQRSESTHSMLRQIKAARERGTQPRSDSALRCKIRRASMQKLSVLER
jgi:hypothetical protein